MPTPLFHPMPALAVGLGLGPKVIPRSLCWAGVACAILPDVDAVGLWLGVPYAHAMGHRGFTHSLAFAAILAALGSAILARRGVSWRISLPFLFFATASHGLLDMLTTGGLGVALAWPLSEARLFAPVQMIRVAPMRPGPFLGPRGVAVLVSEGLWVGLPSLVLGASLAWARRRVAARKATAQGGA